MLFLKDFIDGYIKMLMVDAQPGDVDLFQSSKEGSRASSFGLYPMNLWSKPALTPEPSCCYWWNHKVETASIMLIF